METIFKGNSHCIDYWHHKAKNLLLMAAGRQCDGNGQFISLLKDFREYTTLHGVQYVQRDARYKCRR
jgi:hypothetical protein